VRLDYHDVNLHVSGDVDYYDGTYRIYPTICVHTTKACRSPSNIPARGTYFILELDVYGPDGDAAADHDQPLVELDDIVTFPDGHIRFKSATMGSP